MSEFTEDITTFIEDVAKQNEFRNFEIQSRGGTIKGDNYMGVVKFITIKDKDSDKELDLVLKTAHTSEILRQQVPLKLAYLREIYFYDTVLPELMSFQREHNIQNPFRGAPKLYGVLDKDVNESLLLENLKTSGYKLWNRKMPMDSKHVEIALLEYARFHAISFSLKHLYPEKFDNFAKNLKDIFEDTMTANPEVFKGMIANLAKIGNAAIGDHPASKALSTFESSLMEIFVNEIGKEENRMVILHGDCWCNNMMFKYGDSLNPRKPTEVCLFDWQQAKIGSPVMDLGYFLCVCVDKTIFSDLDRYLKIYHESLSENIREFGCNPENIFTFENLKSQWKKFAKMGLFCAFSLVPAMLSDSKDAVDITAAADSGKDVWTEISSFTVAEDKVTSCNQRLFDLIVYMYDEKLI